jgi:hypothetical protein
MNWELYEIWSIDEDGHEDLIDTTKSIKEAREIATAALDDFDECVIYRENAEGDLVEVERIK